MTAPLAELVARARAFAEDDPDPATRAELLALADSGDAAALEAALEPGLRFGTAGLRGVVGPGPARMNRAVVIRTARALAEELLARNVDGRTLPVVVGRDARLPGHDLLSAVAGTLAAAGIPVRYFPDPVPTPLVAFAVRALAAQAGVVVTASHNPAEYEGVKVYGAEGIQIVPPVDAEIERRAAALPGARRIPVLADALAERAGGASPVPAGLVARYLDQVDSLRPPGGPADRTLRIVHTSLHGVAGAFVPRALARAGFGSVVEVPEQAAPDGRFPTARSPNPEEPGALALAFALAGTERADLVLANDPDADRLAVGVPTATGRFVALTGDQIGLLLADFLLASAPPGVRPIVVSTVVSSPGLDRVAAHHGARLERTLTGFKWIWTAAAALEAASEGRVVFCYEEALGYAAGRSVRDKDGISAALLVAELAARERARGGSLLEALERLERRDGLFVSAQRSRSAPGGAADLASAVSRLADSPPPAIAGRRVTSALDYRAGAAARPRWLGEALLVELALEGGGRVLVRPSGTEPKVKVYADLSLPPPPAGADLAALRRALVADAERAAAEVLGTLGG